MHGDIDLALKDKKGFSPFATAMICKNNTAAKAILKRYPTAAEQVCNLILRLLLDFSNSY